MTARPPPIASPVSSKPPTSSPCQQCSEIGIFASRSSARSTSTPSSAYRSFASAKACSTFLIGRGHDAVLEGRADARDLRHVADSRTPARRDPEPDPFLSGSPTAGDLSQPIWARSLRSHTVVFLPPDVLARLPGYAQAPRAPRAVVVVLVRSYAARSKTSLLGRDSRCAARLRGVPAPVSAGRSVRSWRLLPFQAGPTPTSAHGPPEMPILIAPPRLEHANRSILVVGESPDRHRHSTVIAEDFDRATIEITHGGEPGRFRLQGRLDPLATQLLLRDVVNERCPAQVELEGLRRAGREINRDLEQIALQIAKWVDAGQRASDRPIRVSGRAASSTPGPARRTAAGRLPPTARSARRAPSSAG